MNTIYYKYIKIDLEQFAVFEENIPEKIDEVQIRTEIQFNYDKAQNIICNRLTVMLNHQDKPLLKSVLCSYFSVKEESVKQIKDEKNQIVFAPDILVQFASLNYGSLRGILHLKTLNTPLVNQILPPVSFNQIIDQPFVVE